MDFRSRIHNETVFGKGAIDLLFFTHARDSP
jgi:hypothetical protein